MINKMQWKFDIWSAKKEKGKDDAFVVSPLKNAFCSFTFYAEVAWGIERSSSIDTLKESPFGTTVCLIKALYKSFNVFE